MCGIIYANGKIPVRKSLWKRYEEQKTRGQSGYGYVYLDDGKFKENRAQTEKEIEGTLGEITSSEILFHHRFPTSTPNLPSQTHPILVEGGILKHKYYVVHNGVILEDEKLKERHNKLGIEYSTQIEKCTTIFDGDLQYTLEKEILWNDSEAFAVELALYLEGQVPDLDKVDGSIAFVCIEMNEKGERVKMHYGHNYKSPLILEDTKDIFFLKSEGSGTSVTTNVLFTYDYATGDMSQKTVDIGKGYNYAGYNYNPSTKGYNSSGGHYPSEQRKIGFDYEKYNRENDPLDGDDDPVFTDNDLDLEFMQIELDKLYEKLEIAEAEYQWTKDEIKKDDEVRRTKGGTSLKQFFKYDLKKQKKVIQKLKRDIEELEQKMWDKSYPN